MKVFATLLFVLLFSLELFPQDCNCYKVPIKPDSCFRKCLTKILTEASNEQLKKWGFNEKVSIALLKLKNDTLNFTYDLIREQLTKQDFKDFEKVAIKLNNKTFLEFKEDVEKSKELKMRLDTITKKQ